MKVPGIRELFALKKTNSPLSGPTFWRLGCDGGLCGGFSANVHRVDSQVLNMFTEY